MSGIGQAMIINGVVLFAVLEADLGPHRTIGRFRVLRPVLTAAVIVPFFVKGLTTTGYGLALELAGLLAGLLCGLLAARGMRVYTSPRTGRPVSRAGWGYAAVWCVVIGARAAFSYGSEHWFPVQLATWMGTHRISADALTDALLLMAVTMMLTRTSALVVRARGVRTRTAAAPA
ncbi:hypothetical protein GTY81_17820 [Streptomyces sp. SID8366]|uniref:hypothetical protein n=1 Tax=unclassified Streptomyces TaxID=2593676 RepID=UPI000DB9E694|nr:MULTISPECIES: hypothetical protein [unclassified Streptomyces]MYU05703.1 hypothetical protein [Streptomyces sp. SID8366]MYU66030.1 hypothetical protein [Streptomyces sp. SID69]RAJ63753.1 hypothetical protein K376_00848 [Streptomyces sp. PsTaAH-130]